MEIRRTNQANYNKMENKSVMKSASSAFGSDTVSIGTGSEESKDFDPSVLKELLRPFDEKYEPRSIEWKSPAGQYRHFNGSMMVGSDSSVYLGGASRLQKLDGKTGKVLWEKSLPDKETLQTYPAVEGKDGTILIKTGDGKLRGLDPGTGNEKWNTDAVSLGGGPIVADDGRIFVIGNNAVNILNPDGTAKQQIPVPNAGYELKTVSNGVIIADDRKRGYIGFSPDGKELWCNNANDVDLFPSDPDRVYLTRIPETKKPGADDSPVTIEAIDSKTGDRLWEKSFGEDRPSPMGAYNGKVFVETHGGFSCLDASTGNILWEKKNNHTFDGSSPLYNDGIILVSNDKGIDCLESATGKIKWQVPQQGGFQKPKLKYGQDGLLYLLDGSRIRGINPKSGKIRFACHLDKPGEEFTVNHNDNYIYIQDKKENGAYAMRTQPEKADNTPTTPGTIKDGGEFVDIGGVRLQKKKANASS